MTKQKTLALTALLGGSVLFPTLASAGGYAPPVQRPQVTQNAPIIIPAAPLKVSPVTSAVPAEVQRFLLTAPSGSSVTLNLQTSSKIKVLEVSGNGELAKDMPTAAEMNEMFSEMGNLAQDPMQMVVSVGQVFPDSSRELISTLKGEMPTEDGSHPYTLNIIQRIKPDGTVLATTAKTDEPALQAVLDSLDPKDLNTSNAVDTGVYGMLLRPGTTKTSSQTVDMQGIVASAMAAGAMASMQSQGELSAQEQAEFNEFMQNMQVKAEPLTTNTVTTYQGLNAAGQPTFLSKGQAQDWNLKFNMPEMDGKAAVLNLSVPKLTMQSTSSFLPNGLPANSKATTDMLTNVVIEMPGSRAKMVFQILNDVTMTAE